MRVLMLTSTLPRFPGDMQANFVREQADAWLSARPDAQITILAPHDAKAPLIECHGRLTVVRFRYLWPDGAQALAYPAILPNIRRNPVLAGQVPFFLIAQARAALRLFSETGFDCIYAHWVMPQGIVARWLGRRTGTPYVLQNHSSDLAVFERLASPGRSMAAALLRDALRFYCVNRGQLDAALEFLPVHERQALREKSTVLPMGVADAGATHPTLNGAEIGTIGRLSRKKGLDFLIGALEALAHEGIRPRLEIAGNGEERAALEGLVSRSDTRFLGFVDGADKADFLASCQRFAFPAKAHDGDVEGLPVALLEALMRGQPVLATRDTNVELLPEWDQIRDDIVFVPDPADPAALKQGLIELLAKQPGQSQRAPRVLARYRWENLIEEYLAPLEAAHAVARSG